ASGDARPSPRAGRKCLTPFRQIRGRLRDVEQRRRVDVARAHHRRDALERADDLALLAPAEPGEALLETHMQERWRAAQHGAPGGGKLRMHYAAVDAAAIALDQSAVLEPVEYRGDRRLAQ